MRILKELSWDVDEETYRKDEALSYSTLAKYEREGFNKLSHLFDKVSTPSLTFGSAVDAIITGGQREFDDRFMVADFPSIGDSVLKMVKELFNLYNQVYTKLQDIPNEKIIELSEQLSYQLNWKPETRARVIKEQGSEYYNLLYAAGYKTILDNQTALDVDLAVRSLRDSKNTDWYFASNNPFDESVQRFYQLKFKATFDDVNYRGMLDEVIVDHNKKEIHLIDLKTSSHYEWDFFKSFVEWNYAIQARLYYRLVKENLKNTEYEDYKIRDYKFIVINRRNLMPLIWEFLNTKTEGDLKFKDSKGNLIIMRDPFTIGEELNYYLEDYTTVPIGIKPTNTIEDWISKI